jgi:hypothetical protein
MTAKRLPSESFEALRVNLALQRRIAALPA